MDDIDERLAAFSRLFAEQAGTSAEAIESASNTGDVHRLQQLCHSLAGRAGMFGVVRQPTKWLSSSTPAGS